MTFREYLVEYEIMNNLRKFGSHFSINQRQNIANMHNLIVKDIEAILKNIDNTRNTFLNKLSRSEYAQDLENFASNPIFKESWGGALGAAGGFALGGPVGALYGAGLGHLAGKAVNAFKPQEIQLRRHVYLEKKLLGHLETLMYMIENARSPEDRNLTHSKYMETIRYLIERLTLWQQYYNDQGGKGELFGSKLYRRPTYYSRKNTRRSP